MIRQFYGCYRTNVGWRAVDDSSPLVSYAPGGAWTDSPAGDSLIQVRPFAWHVVNRCVISWGF